MNITRYLIVRSSGDMRVTTKRPRLRLDEVAFKVNVAIPDAWGRVQTDELSLAFPEPPEGAVLRVVDEADAQ